MQRMAIVIAVTMLVVVGCKAKKKGDDSAKGGMTPAAMADMDAMDGMEPMDAMDPMEPEATGDDATAEFDKILAQNKELAKIMEGIKTLDDLKKAKPQYVKINIAILKLSIATLKKAVKLPDDKLKAYVAKNTAMNKANAEFGKKLMQLQKRIMKIKGAKKFIAETQKELSEKLTPLAKELGALSKEYLKKTAASVGMDGKPVPMK